MEQSVFRATALKHRPQTFAELIGQDHIAQSLTNAIKHRRISHAYLFSGPRGVGKTSAARIMAKSLNCEQGPTATPCGVCSNCREITASSSLDVYEIDGASNNSVEQVRELRETVHFSPSKSKYKIYIIDEVHMLTDAAFNALLKTLEEPPESVIFIFATTEPAKVKITIRSRCQHYRFRRIPARQIAAHLLEICTREQLEATQEAAFLVAKAGDGSMRDAQSMFDQIVSYAGGSFTETDVREVIGIIDSATYFEFITYLLERDTKELVKRLGEMDDAGVDFANFAAGLAEMLRNLILIIEGATPAELDLTAEDYRELSSFHDPSSSDGFNEDNLILLLDILVDLAKELQYARNPRRLFELYIFKLLNFRNLIEPYEILNRIEHLQRVMANSKEPQSGTPQKKPGSSMNIELGGFQPAPLMSQQQQAPQMPPQQQAPQMPQQAPQMPQQQQAPQMPQQQQAPQMPQQQQAPQMPPQQQAPQMPQQQQAPQMPPQQQAPQITIPGRMLLQELINNFRGTNTLGEMTLKGAHRAEVHGTRLSIFFPTEFHRAQMSEPHYLEIMKAYLEERTGRKIQIDLILDKDAAPEQTANTPPPAAAEGSREEYSEDPDYDDAPEYDGPDYSEQDYGSPAPPENFIPAEPDPESANDPAVAGLMENFKAKIVSSEPADPNGTDH